MKGVEKVRLDVLLVERKLAESREKAQAMILAGQVLSGDKLLEKPGIKVDPGIDLRVRGESDKYVSRGAYKLLGGLEKFKVSLEGKVCLDVGASTGGFTQVCLEYGAVKVYAIDVGTNQLHWKIRSDSRVVSRENVNFRNAERNLIPEKVQFVCIDTSFISLRLILPSVLLFLDANAEVIALVKPQHEVGKEFVGKGGLVRDAEAVARTNQELLDFAQKIGFEVLGLIESPIKGTTGNTEFLLHLRGKHT